MSTPNDYNLYQLQPLITECRYNELNLFVETNKELVCGIVYHNKYEKINLLSFAISSKEDPIK